MIAAAICPKCKHEFWLMDEPTFEPGGQPPKYLGESPITFLCCGQEQTVPPSSIVYRPQRVIKSKSAQSGWSNSFAGFFAAFILGKILSKLDVKLA